MSIYKITEADLALLPRFREVTPRKPDLYLARLLHRLKCEGGFGKIVIAPTGPGEWALCRTGPTRGAPIEFIDERRFTRLIDAQCAVLRKRWEKHTDIPWPAELDW